MNISRGDSKGRISVIGEDEHIKDKLSGNSRNCIYQLLDRIPKREYLSPVRMNISRIEFAKGETGFTTIGYWEEDRKEKETHHRLG